MVASGPPVTVVVPCFNEEAGLPVLLARLRAMRRTPQTRDWHVLVVDDGSTDRTFAELLRAARDEPWIAIARHHEHLGLGAALRTGFAQAVSPVLCTLDSDCTHPPERLPELTARLADGAQIVTAAAPRPDGNGVDGRTPLPLRRAVSRLYTQLIGQDLSALTCLFRAYDREAIQRIRFRANGFSAVGEILLRALLAGHTVHEVPMPWEARRAGESKRTPADRFMADVHLFGLAALVAAAQRVRHAFPGRSV